MRTLTRRLAPHARETWLAFAAASVVVLALAITLVAVGGGSRVAVGMTAFCGIVATVVLAAFLDAILAPGNPDMARGPSRATGWGGAALPFGGGHGVGDPGGSGDSGSSS